MLAPTAAPRKHTRLAPAQVSGMVRPMLQIHHAEDDGRSPSKTYADTCWTADPRISPTWWHELQGHTVGKLALDWRREVFAPEKLGQGCNLVVASPSTWPAACAAMASSLQPNACVSILVSADVSVPEISPTFVVWDALAPSAAERTAALVALETAVKDGLLDGYGVFLRNAVEMPLHQWLAEAQDAAAVAWGRRKRPALRLLAGRMDLLDLSLLHAPVTTHKDEMVSTLELASRLGLATLIMDSALPGNDEPDDLALAALMRVAEVEQALNQQLGGWPEVGGQRMFSVLAHLAEGRTPWPTPAHWYGWRDHVWPLMAEQWRTAAPSELTETYLNALEMLLPYGESMAQATCQPLLEQVLAHVTPRLPLAWQQDDAMTRCTGLLTSLPGVTALAIHMDFRHIPAMHHDTLADIGSIVGDL